ncbi:M48 family metalloprotease [Halovenus sp. HT40]|uniref:M48 family metalloprotease n=1 Tax=Halovenus sp. HT40 TaxID=3126691 RepID=UPI00300E9F82
MLPDDSALRRRLLLTAVLVVALPFLFIYAFEFAVNRFLVPILESQGYGPYYGHFYVAPGFAVVVVVGGLAVQARYGPQTVLRSIGARETSSSSHPELHAAVTRLAQQADVEPPAVAVTDNDAPNAAAVRGPSGEGTIVLTTGLLDELDDEELTAVLAHELAHLTNRDATVMTVAWVLPTVTYYLAIVSAYLLYRLPRSLAGGSSGGDDGGAAKAIIVLVATALMTLAVSALFWAASVLVHRLLSRYREFAADRGAAALTGDPAALASALETMDETMEDVPDEDLRALDGGAEALYAAPLESRAFTDAELVSTDIFPETHPPTSERVDRLYELAGEME